MPGPPPGVSAATGPLTTSAVEVGGGAAIGAGKAVAIGGAVIVGRGDEDVLSRDVGNLLADFVAQDAGESEEIGAADCDAGVSGFKDQGANGQCADFFVDGFGRTDAA